MARQTKFLHSLHPALGGVVSLILDLFSFFKYYFCNILVNRNQNSVALFFHLEICFFLEFFLFPGLLF